MTTGLFIPDGPPIPGDALFQHAHQRLGTRGMIAFGHWLAEHGQDMHDTAALIEAVTLRTTGWRGMTDHAIERFKLWTATP